ncbi:hypothetical protein JCGZ_25292 [Jatropha curcas]|uniref:Aminotransferase-like plant mobile domain-containing protein n=1 Tax=Jatropha curcas TaxID=180498 RepID=A0A067JPV4_JATCU|nr:hypothetical protein JCGZ_25292 [Jatropha curcas]
MTSSSHSSDEDFLESLGISLDEIRVIADADTHASVTGVYAQDSYIRLDVGESSVAEIPIDIFDHNNPVGAIISPSHLDFLRHLELGRQNYKSLLGALAERWKEKFNPSILKSLEDLAHLTEYDWAGAILSRMYDDMCDLSRGHCKLSGTYYFWETWAFEYFPYIRPELTHTDLGLGLVPVGLVSQMMELVLGMQEELTLAWTLRAFDDQRRRRPRR